MKMTAKELRDKWLSFFVERGHKDVGVVSLISDGSTGALFNVAGMQPIVPYLLGKPHPLGKRLVNIQGCIRTVDIEEVGDASHHTFFEMMGNWSLNDYFKKEKTAWSFELLTKVFGFDAGEICSTVFEGNKDAPRDEETAQFLQQAGVKKENIFYLPKENNWWELESEGTPCGPCNEWFYPRHNKKCSPGCNGACECGRYVEIGNDVYMQFVKKGANKYEPAKEKNVDTGFGFERLLMFLNGFDECYKTDLFQDAIKIIEKLSSKQYGKDEQITRSMRIIADHVRTSAMLLGDEKLLKPSNVMQGYILRRLIRRAVRHAKMLGMPEFSLTDVAKAFLDGSYYSQFATLQKNREIIFKELVDEETKFTKTLSAGIKELDKLISNLKQFAPQVKSISGDKAFRLFDTFGFPLELTQEMAGENGYSVDAEGFEKAFELHRKKSQAGAEKAGEFKGGLADDSVQTTRLHTAAHLVHAALGYVLKSECRQAGSNITPERLRFDFTFNRKVEDAELKQVEDLVNEQIKKNIPVVMKEMSVQEAKDSGAIGVFDSKYGDVVKVYAIGDFSKEICGGPHAKTTSELGKFKITKEESAAAGVRRIRAVLE